MDRNINVSVDEDTFYKFRLLKDRLRMNSTQLLKYMIQLTEEYERRQRK